VPHARAILEPRVDMAGKVDPLAKLHGPHRRVVDLVGGSPGTVHAGLADFIAATGGDELILRSAIPDHARSKRSRFITLFQAAMKSRTHFSCASELP
jgi:alkanesulfonate monooxygenase SsuD/methylene tetrahydromethanopterin reductase-like flavin-dependent oxidoreductase (luciferase family)